MNSSAPILASKGELVCRPVQWLDVARFLLFNFVLHAATVLSSPGDGILLSSFKRLTALSMPLLGTVPAIRAIYRYARGENRPLEVALRARALCMVRYKSVTLGRIPTVTAYLEGLQRTISPALTTIQGQFRVEKETIPSWLAAKLRHTLRPHSYEECLDSEQLIEPRLVVVPHSFTVDSLLPRDQSTLKIGYNFNTVRIIAAIAQIASGSYQLYRSSGPQIERFGYAAYELAIIPYSIMSLINLLATLCEPEFSAMLLVRDDTATADIVPRISGEVGICTDTCSRSIHDIRMKEKPWTEIMLLIGCFILGTLSIVGPYLVIWVLTSFKLGQNPGTENLTMSGFLKWNTKTPWSQGVVSIWVFIWIAYGQILSVCTLMTFRMRGLNGLLTFSLMVLLGVAIAYYGFFCVIKLMLGDSICVVV